MKTYPIMLDLRGRRAVVVGGGAVGLRKARGLREAGAAVRLVTGGVPSAEADPQSHAHAASAPSTPSTSSGQAAEQRGLDMAHMARAGADIAPMTVIEEKYRAEFLEGAELVFACTDDRAVNAQVSADGRRIGAWVNAADQPEECDFYLPAVTGEGDVVIAVGTGGAAPGLAATIRNRLARAMPPQIGEFAATLEKIREEMKVRLPLEERTRRMKVISAERGYAAFLSGGEKALREMLEAATDGGK